jgi:hypothetical protein
MSKPLDAFLHLIGQVEDVARRRIIPADRTKALDLSFDIMQAGLRCNGVTTDREIRQDLLDAEEAALDVLRIPRGASHELIAERLNRLYRIRKLLWKALPRSETRPTERSVPTSQQAIEPSRKPSKLATALALLQLHPDWTNKQIAASVPCNEKYLSQSPHFKNAKKTLKAIGRGTIHRGSKSKEGDLEAED